MPSALYAIDSPTHPSAHLKGHRRSVTYNKLVIVGIRKF